MAITITGITPATGPTTGTTTHHITGTDMTLVTGVTIGGVAVTSFSALSATLMKVVAPASGSTGAKDVVLNPGAVTLVGGFTYTAPDSTEQLVSTLARKWRIDVNTGTEASPVWTQVRAIGEFKPTMDNNMEEDADYDNEGWGSETKTMITWGGELTLFRKKGVVTGNYDPGQQSLWTAHDKFGAEGSRQIRYYDRDGGPEAYKGYVSVGWEPEGGEAKDLDTVTLTLTGQGKRTLISNPAVV